MRITITYRTNLNYTKEKYVIAIFNSADDLLSLCDFLKENSFFTDDLSLYKYNKKYIVLFPLSFPIDKTFFCLKEFGKIKFVCENTIAHIKEYGILICNNLKPLLK